MHKELIGQQASLSLPCSVDTTTLLLGFIEELMEVSGDEADDPDRLERELRGAVETICGAGVAERNVLARFEIHAGGVDVRLTCDNHGAADVDEQRVVARPA